MYSGWDRDDSQALPPGSLCAIRKHKNNWVRSIRKNTLLWAWKEEGDAGRNKKRFHQRCGSLRGNRVWIFRLEEIILGKGTIWLKVPRVTKVRPGTQGTQKSCRATKRGAPWTGSQLYCCWLWWMWAAQEVPQAAPESVSKEVSCQGGRVGPRMEVQFQRKGGS